MVRSNSVRPAMTLRKWATCHTCLLIKLILNSLTTTIGRSRNWRVVCLHFECWGVKSEQSVIEKDRILRECSLYRWSVWGIESPKIYSFFKTWKPGVSRRNYHFTFCVILFLKLWNEVLSVKDQASLLFIQISNSITFSVPCSQFVPDTITKHARKRIFLSYSINPATVRKGSGRPIFTGPKSI